MGLAMSSTKTIELLPEHPAKFWSRVNVGKPEECWNWKTCVDRNGYGMFKTGNWQKGMWHYYYAHRVAFFLATGRQPWELQVCHSCDNPRCCNPDHLFLGTNWDNARDCVKKGRVPLGEARSGAKLTAEKVREIRSALLDGCSRRELAQKFNMSWNAIRDISIGRSWRHVR